MRTTLVVDKKLLEEASRYAGVKSPSDTVNKALREFVRRRKLQELRRLLKETTLEDTWEADEEAELARMRNQEHP
jgi:Arc/MetJ family transcription regulator